jgi:hypothetical protein
MAWKRAILAMAILAMVAGGTSLAQTLAAGDDALNTPGGGQTQFDLSSVPIQDVFGAPVDGSTLITLRGRPFDPQRFPGVDTIVRRPQSITIGTTGQASGPIQIVGLSLESEKTVQIGGQPYSLVLNLSQNGQTAGTTTLTRTNGDGGTFSATLPVVPKLSFTNQNDGSVVTLDCGAVKCQPFNLTISNVGWVRSGGPGGFNPSARGETLLPRGAVIDSDGDGTADLQLLGSSNFFPGLTPSSGFPESPFGIAGRRPGTTIIIIIHWIRGPIIIISTGS